jgi:pyocin large subunit-like protein
MKPKHGLTAGALIALIVAVTFALRSPHVANAPHPAHPASATTGAAASAPSHPDIGFHSHQHLVEHYEKHGGEFGGVGMDEYLRLAQVLRDRPAGGDVLEFVRSDGVVTRYDRASGAFIAFDSDLEIRTFFKPNDGEAYFRRQALREH